MEILIFNFESSEIDFILDPQRFRKLHYRSFPFHFRAVKDPISLFWQPQFHLLRYPCRLKQIHRTNKVEKQVEKTRAISATLTEFHWDLCIFVQRLSTCGGLLHLDPAPPLVPLGMTPPNGESTRAVFFRRWSAVCKNRSGNKKVMKKKKKVITGSANVLLMSLQRWNRTWEVWSDCIWNIWNFFNWKSKFV